VEMYVRGASADAIRKGCDAVDRAVHGAAQMIGVSAEIENTPGYLPIAENELLNSVFAENAVSVLGKEAVVFGQEITGSTDVGDLSNVLPVIQPSVGGFLGNLHGNSFTVADPETAYVLPAKLMALTVADLLYGGAESAKRIRDTFVPSMTKKQYISYLEGEKT